MIKIYEVTAEGYALEKLIRFSEDWAAENSCYGYRANDKSDIEGNRVFFAEDDGEVVGYLFGKVYQSEHMKSIMPELPAVRRHGNGRIGRRGLLRDEALAGVVQGRDQGRTAVRHGVGQVDLRPVIAEARRAGRGDPDLPARPPRRV